ncbi:ABC transporter permease [Robiginitalea sediminis]|uniref:ABC transporter permease n=1 Tax=Robiginitalea sediminis TaxID=1982593 RepID=UPI000B4B7475|nr:FtsX-like permease family protein [Robiginitalea sediminis]
MAWRDGRASLRRLLLFMSSIVLGIAALVAIQNFGMTLEENIAGQSRELMGADFLVDMESEPDEALRDTIALIPGTYLREVNFASMLSFPDREGTRLVRIRGVEPGFPFYGELTTRPEAAAGAFGKAPGALVDATVMTQYALRPGDSVTIGNLTLPIAASLVDAPGNTQVSTSVAPAIWIPYDQIAATGLIQVGSRVEYNYYFQVPEGTDLGAIYDRWDAVLDDANADMDLHTDTSDRLGRRYQNVGRFLKLVAFIALLLGCLGIASSVHIYMKEKRASIAILKCLGASRRQSLLIFLFQIAGIGLLGGIVGTGLGLVLQAVFPQLIGGLLPVELQWSTHWEPVALGLVLGVGMALLFGLLPLLGSWFVSPLAVLRVAERTPAMSNRITTAVLLLIFGVLWGVSVLLLERPLRALWFVLGLAAVFLVLALIAWGIMWGVRRYFPHGWGFEARQGLLNLFRPNNQTLVLILAIGIGTFLISTLYFTQDMLLARARMEDDRPAANLILLDVQAGQQESVAAQIRPTGMEVLENIPIVTMRLASIAGRTVEAIRADSTSTINQWILSHEFRVTYRDSLIPSEVLQEGEWASSYAGTGPVPVSLSDNVARDARVTIGDTLVFNVQGVLMDTYVASIRQVDWGRMQLNFSVVFPPGVLEDAPRFHVMTTYAPDTDSSARLQQALVRNFPNITVLDIRQILDVITDILDKIGWVIRFMAFFSILTGLIVLLGAVRTSKYQRIRESVLLRTLGAQGRQILRISAMEYFFLGAIGGLMGAVLALLATELLAYGVFEVPFTPSWVPFGVVFPVITLLVLGIGLANSRGVIKSPPLEVLRKEGV